MESIKAPNSLEEMIRDSTAAATIFVKHYYAAIDSKSSDRATSVHSLYSPTSRITWNGNPIPYNDLIPFIERLPVSLHEVQAFDCHPISGTSTGPPPSLVVSVTGQVTSGPSAPSPSQSGNIQSRDYDFLPRVFNQSFILTYQLPPQLGGASRPIEELDYCISADAFRFC